jgi:hypothetical protein
VGLDAAEPLAASIDAMNLMDIRLLSDRKFDELHIRLGSGTRVS